MSEIDPKMTNDNEPPKVDWTKFQADQHFDMESFFNLRDWLRAVLEGAGCRITDSGMGMGKADLGFEISGNNYGVSIWPRMKQ